MKRKLRRVPEKAWLSGISAGIAYKFELPVWFVRLLWVFVPSAIGAAIGAPSIARIVILLVIGLSFYGVLGAFIPSWGKTPDDFEKVTAG